MMPRARRPYFLGCSALILLAFSFLTAAADSDYNSAKRKLDSIELDHVRPGARILLSYAELNAYATQEAPPGVRNPKLSVTSPGVATGTALIDFGKLERSTGAKPGWLMAKLLDGERPVTVTAHIETANGHGTVEVNRVEISGLAIDGRTLDFLIQNILLPLYPDAVVGKPFALGHNVDRITVVPAGVTVAIAPK
jgi:hypothetical protein